MKRYIRCWGGEDGWSKHEMEMATQGWHEVDEHYHRDLSGGMLDASKALENLGYTIEWDNRSDATTSIDAYKKVSKNGKQYTFVIWCYYYPYNRDKEKYLVDCSIKDSHGKYLCGTDSDFPNVTRDGLTEDLFINLDDYNKESLEKL